MINSIPCFRELMVDWWSVSIEPGDVRFGSKADMCSAQADVRFVPKADIAGTQKKSATTQT
jgi:hypothetical protein